MPQGYRYGYDAREDRDSLEQDVAELEAEIERLRAALEDIAVRGKIITNGDCGVLRDHARRALGLEPLDT